MKFICYDKDYSIYLNKLYLKDIDIYNSDIITDYIKKILLKLNDYYEVKLNGFYKIYVYANNKYGIIMDIKKIEDYDSYGIDNVDLKIILKKNSEMFLKTDNFDIIKDMNCFFIKDNNYYINIENIDRDYINYIEFFDIIYKDIDKVLNNAIMIKRSGLSEYDLPISKSNI